MIGRKAGIRAPQVLPISLPAVAVIVIDQDVVGETIMIAIAPPIICLDAEKGEDRRPCHLSSQGHRHLRKGDERQDQFLHDGGIDRLHTTPETTTISVLAIATADEKVDGLQKTGRIAAHYHRLLIPEIRGADGAKDGIDRLDDGMGILAEQRVLRRRDHVVQLQ